MAKAEGGVRAWKLKCPCGAHLFHVEERQEVWVGPRVVGGSIEEVPETRTTYHVTCAVCQAEPGGVQVQVLQVQVQLA